MRIAAVTGAAKNMPTMPRNRQARATVP